MPSESATLHGTPGKKGFTYRQIPSSSPGTAATAQLPLGKFESGEISKAIAAHS